MNKFLKGLWRFNLTIATGGTNLIIEECVNAAKNRKATKDILNQGDEMIKFELELAEFNKKLLKACEDEMRAAGIECKRETK